MVIVFRQVRQAIAYPNLNVKIVAAHVSAAVVNAYCIKPLDEKRLLESARETGAFVSV